MRKRLQVKIFLILFAVVICHFILEQTWNAKGHNTLIGSLLRSFLLLFGRIDIYGTYNGIVPESSLSSSDLDKAYSDLEVPLLVLFTTWIDKKIDAKRHNITLHNWASFAPSVIPIIFTDDLHLAEKCQYFGWKVETSIDVTAGKKPVLKSMFIQAMKKYRAIFYAFANSDILFTGSLLKTLFQIRESSLMDKNVFMTGIRTNVDDIEPYEAKTSETLIDVVKSRGELFREDAADYFITNQKYPWSQALPALIATPGVDNIMLVNALQNQYIVIDVTKTVLAIHQTVKGNNYESFLIVNDYNLKLVASMDSTADLSIGSAVCAKYHTLDQGHLTLAVRRLPMFCLKRLILH